MLGSRRDSLRLGTCLPAGLVLSYLCAKPLLAQTPSVRAAAMAVLYPEVTGPFAAIFATILEGIDERLQARTHRIAVAANVDVASVITELRKRELKVVIALGRAGMRVAGGLDLATDVVAGCIVSPGEAESRAAAVLSLAPDPLLLMQRLKALQPASRRVVVVYSARHSGWLQNLAQNAARHLGLELRAIEVEDLKAALRAYQDFFAQALPQDALWLPQDSLSVDESAVLPLVLQECWNRNLPLFSSNLAHVKRGALFSLYPNNLELGRSLGASALAQLQRSPAGPPGLRGVQPLRDVHAAINTRTASHLGLEASAQRGFELSFPER